MHGRLATVIFYLCTLLMCSQPSLAVQVVGSNMIDGITVTVY